MRLKANLRDIADLKQYARAPLQDLLVQYKHVVCLKRGWRKCSRKSFERYVYELAQAEEADNTVDTLTHDCTVLDPGCPGTRDVEELYS